MYVRPIACVYHSSLAGHFPSLYILYHTRDKRIPLQHLCIEGDTLVLRYNLSDIWHPSPGARGVYGNEVEVRLELFVHSG